MPPPTDFPAYGVCPAKDKLDDLVRLLAPDLFQTEFIDARSAAKLVAKALRAYRASLTSPKWQANPTLAAVTASGIRFNLVCAALFDLVCNAEYIHGRVTNDKWIYCNRHRDAAGTPEPVAYFSFLKQCPRCCLDRGLETRLSGAQHKPSSHHIGEITTTAAILFVEALARTAATPLRVGVISKQSHDVDALAWSRDLLILFEVKASPLVTYPLRTKLPQPFRVTGADGPVEAAQHKLIDVEFGLHDLSLFLANTGVDIPLGRATQPEWPYPQITDHVSNVDGLLQYLEAWAEVFFAYKVPKTARVGRQVVLGYLANGWGDEIDSNKTKAGLGRTDDIKKGTYQLLKYGAYYRSGSPNVAVRGALVANLDPLFMYADYMEKLIDARWAPSTSFKDDPTDVDFKRVLENDLFYLYDAVLTFNRPVLNDPLLASVFQFNVTENALRSGQMDALLASWGAP